MSETTKELERLVEDASYTHPAVVIRNGGWHTDAVPDDERKEFNRRFKLLNIARPKLSDMALALAAEVLARRKWETQARTALEALLAVVAESEGITGWHLNGNVASWGEFDFVDDADNALQDWADAQHGNA